MWKPSLSRPSILFVEETIAVIPNPADGFIFFENPKLKSFLSNERKFVVALIFVLFIKGRSAGFAIPFEIYFALLITALPTETEKALVPNREYEPANPPYCENAEKVKIKNPKNILLNDKYFSPIRFL